MVCPTNKFGLCGKRLHSRKEENTSLNLKKHTSQESFNLKRSRLDRDQSQVQYCGLGIPRVLKKKKVVCPKILHMLLKKDQLDWRKMFRTINWNIFREDQNWKVKKNELLEMVLRDFIFRGSLKHKLRFSLLCHDEVSKHKLEGKRNYSWHNNELIKQTPN